MKKDKILPDFMSQKYKKVEDNKNKMYFCAFKKIDNPFK